MRRVSVILCSYNSLNYLKDTLLNIYEQDYKNIEVIDEALQHLQNIQANLKNYTKKYNSPQKVCCDKFTTKCTVD